ncbi:pentapeptide repeat-containing protein [Sorangium sp. So ce887]|uniref:pentapeptide repeat-containing protein n=1 Tax=Sorangium sp. So ce887 TaxID=3133324 RepID=UPI003F63D23D
MNGASLNGASLNGASLNGASLNGASSKGASLKSQEAPAASQGSCESSSIPELFTLPRHSPAPGAPPRAPRAL